MQVGQIHIVSKYCAMKMNIFPIILVKLVHQELIISPGDYHDEYIYSEINGGFYSCQDDIIQFCNTEILNDMIQTQTGINTLEGKRRGEELCDSEPSCTGFQLYCGSQSCNDQSVVDIYFFKDDRADQ